MNLLTRNPQTRLASITSVDGGTVNGRVDPAGSARGLPHNLSGYAPWIAAAQVCLLIAMLVMAGGVMGWCLPAQGADQSPVAQAQIPPPGTPLTFDEAVKIAIIQSPFLSKSSLEIDIRRLDESDSRYGMVPPLTFRTYYYVNRPSGVGYGHPYSISFSTDPYNPLGAYYTLQAQKLVTQSGYSEASHDDFQGAGTPGDFLPGTGHLAQDSRLSEEPDSGGPGKPHLL